MLQCHNWKWSSIRKLSYSKCPWSLNHNAQIHQHCCLFIPRIEGKENDCDNLSTVLPQTTDKPPSGPSAVIVIILVHLRRKFSQSPGKNACPPNKCHWGADLIFSYKPISWLFVKWQAPRAPTFVYCCGSDSGKRWPEAISGRWERFIWLKSTVAWKRSSLLFDNGQD